MARELWAQKSGFVSLLAVCLGKRKKDANDRRHSISVSFSTSDAAPPKPIYTENISSAKAFYIHVTDLYDH